jgi:hypothetical protein
MLISDEFEVPFEATAEWAAIAAAAIAYGSWCLLTFVIRQRYFSRPASRLLATTVLLSSGLLLYVVAFTTIHQFGYRNAVLSSYPGALNARTAALLDTLVAERARSFLIQPASAGIRGLAFYAGPAAGLLGGWVIAHYRRRKHAAQLAHAADFGPTAT